MFRFGTALLAMALLLAACGGSSSSIVLVERSARVLVVDEHRRGPERLRRGQAGLHPELRGLPHAEGRRDDRQRRAEPRRAAAAEGDGRPSGQQRRRPDAGVQGQAHRRRRSTPSRRTSRRSPARADGARSLLQVVGDPLQQVPDDARRRAPDEVVVDAVDVGAERHAAAQQAAPRVPRRAAGAAGTRGPRRPRPPTGATRARARSGRRTDRRRSSWRSSGSAGARR